MTDDGISDDTPARRERLVYVPVSQLTEGPHAPAAVAVPEELIQSLKTYGVLHPLLVRPGESGYEVIAGFRRLRAAKAAELTEVPARVYRAEDESLAAMYAASNNGNSGKGPVVTTAPLSKTDGISSGTLGGFLEEELGRKSTSTPYVKIVGTAAVILIIAWIGLVVSKNMRGRAPRSPRPEPTATREPLQRPLDRPNTGGNTSPAVTDWQQILNEVSGIEVRNISGVPRIVFSEPVFSRLTTIDPDQKARLNRLVRLIVETEPRSVIMVIGHTDNDPIRPTSEYRSNEYLSELRANAVIDFLKESGTAPERQLKPVAVGAEDPPFSNANPEDKARNRTVTLEILQPVN